MTLLPFSDSEATSLSPAGMTISRLFPTIQAKLDPLLTSAPSPFWN